MKKVLLLTIMLASFAFAKAQNYLLMYIEDIEPEQVFEFCLQDYDSIVIVDTICDFSYDSHWYAASAIGADYCEEWGPVLTIIPDDELYYRFIVSYKSCDGEYLHFQIKFYGFSSPETGFSDFVWKHEDETITLVAPDNGSYLYTPYYWYYEWSTGETQREIEVADPGIYRARLYNNCGEAIDSIEVRNEVEISLASTDLTTNLNQINWSINNAQSSYIVEVNVYRNGQLVGTIPYADGSFLDNIGNEATQWQYHVVGVTADGEECPVSSYWTRTIHLDHLQGQSNHVLQWTSYETESDASVVAYRIYDWFEAEMHLIEEVGYFTNVYNYNPNVFAGDAVVAAVLSSGELSYSNRVPTHLGLSETTESQLYVYPNPAKNHISIEGKGILNITNTLGQTILLRKIDGKESIELPKGLYFVRLGDETLKVVVE